MKNIFTLLSVAFLLTVVMTACTRSANDAALTKNVAYEDTVGFAQFQSWKQQNERLDPNQVFSQQQVAAAPAAPAQVVKTVYKKQSAPVATAPAPAKKKGWSKAAKGTVIGAGSGAIIGAVINKKNRALGAAIGGVIGGGVGYGLGRGMDKRDGR